MQTNYKFTTAKACFYFLKYIVKIKPIDFLTAGFYIFYGKAN